MTRRLPKRAQTRAVRLRAELFTQQGGRCHYCARAMQLRTYAVQDQLQDDDATIEHLVPRVLGGSDSAPNLVAACHACNHIGSRIDRWAAHAFTRTTRRTAAS